ncbi:MAG: hypothetical protein ACLRPN_10210 [Blautia massiliensis (ex Durand et al. 2017)]|uniref:hypothetical protein n=1 Tax=Blautia massiliensis (ex Durand et al. 2017) TaxID=1737424 RepID=UPI003990CE77
MNRYLTIYIRKQLFRHLSPLSSHAGRSYKKQISQAKFRPGGIRKTDSSAG